jgi:hypothetical protein
MITKSFINLTKFMDWVKVQMATSPEEGLEKSATLLIALGEDHAAEVLKHLGPREVQKIGHAMAALKSVPRAKVEGILDEFLSVAEEHAAVHVDTDNYIRSVLTKALGSDKAANLLDRILQGNGRMGIGPRIQDDAVRIKTHLLYLVYQLSFDVGLEIVYLYIRILLTESGKVVFKSNTAINGRFAFTQQIYIGAVNNLYSHNTFFYTFVHREHSFKVQR